MSVYTILRLGLEAALKAGEITPEQARITSMWLDLQENAPS